MASYSSSKAASMPEWRKNLDATPVEELCSSQKDIIRGVSLLDNLVEECTKLPPVSVRDMDRAVRLAAGLLEVKSLRFQGISMLNIYPEKSKLVRDTLAKLASENVKILRSRSSGSSLPADTETMPNRLFLLLHFLLSKTEDALRVYRGPGSKDALYLESLRNLSLGTPPWAVPCLNELKTSGGDLLLKQVGSNLTVDQLLTWNKVLAPFEHIAKCCLAEDPTEMVLPMLDIVYKWLETFAHAPPADTYSWYLARKVFDITFASKNPKTLEQRTAPLGAELMQKIEQKRGTLMWLMKKTFSRRLKVARDAVPEDPVQIAWNSLIFARLTAGDYAQGQVLSQMDLVEESRAAAQRAKPWLPPAMYKTIKFNIKVQEDMMHGLYQGSDDANKDMFKNALAAQAKLEECCNVCKSRGREFALKCCSQCKKVYYCSKECQKKDWKQHKKVCKKD